MRVSDSNMKKLGFTRYGQWWEHDQLPDIRFWGDNPEWSEVIEKAFDIGRDSGKDEALSGVRKSLGIL